MAGYLVSPALRSPTSRPSVKEPDTASGVVVPRQPVAVRTGQVASETKFQKSASQPGSTL